MALGPSDAAIEEAQIALDSSQSYGVSKGEKILNVTGDKLLAASNSQHVAMTQNAATSLNFSAVKEKVSNFVENSKILVNVLDDIGRMHPFIQTAVVVFKAGIQLELTRRENDDRVLALNTTMCEMMSTLRLLKKLPSPHERYDGLTVEERLHGRMLMVVQSIRDCAQLCDSYQRRHAAVKFFTSLKWQSKFTGVAEQFAEHQNVIQSDLQLYLAFEISHATSILSTLNQNVSSMMEVVFERMQPTKEREIAVFVQSKGGHAEAPSDQLLKDVMKHEQQLQRKDEKVNANLRAAQPPDLPTDLTTFWKELEKDVDSILKENSKIFEQRFDAIELRLKEVKGIIHRESDRVIETILVGVGKGPRERIVDRDVYHVWAEMGWKGSVRATYLVMALHEHFSTKSRNALEEIHAIANEPDQTSAEEKLRDIASITQQALPATPAEDLWSLRFITIHRIQPLIEALDDDGSSFITVNEVNAFTSSRPEGWSLPRWIAYWTIGFEMTTHWYYQRICRLLSFIARSSKGVLPANRRIVSKFLKSWPLNALQHHLSGLRNVDFWDSTDWEDNYIFLKFKGWVVDTENKMEEILRKLVYFIDQDNTLDTVTGGGRPEKYMMPIFYLLLKRSYSIMQKAHDTVMHKDEFETLQSSMFIVHSAIRERVSKLEAIYTLQNIKKEEKLRSIFFGLYTCTFEKPEKGEFWTRNMDLYDTIPDEPSSSTSVKLVRETYYEPPAEELDLDTHWNTERGSSLSSSAKQGELAQPENHAHSLVGAWSGSYSYELLTASDGPVSFSITQHTADDLFQCSGVDIWGPFLVNGRVSGDQILFMKTYEELQEGTRISWRYQGLLNGDRTMISGSWGLPMFNEEEELLIEESIDGLEKDNHGDEDPKGSDGGDANAAGLNIVVEPPTPNEVNKAGDQEGTSDEDGSLEAGYSWASDDADDSGDWEASGTFVLHRRPVDYILYCPSDEEIRENKPRALWTLVRNVAKYWFKSRHISWEVIRERRDKRKAFLELWEKGENRRIFDNTADETVWDELVRSVHPDDNHLWRSIAQFKHRREPVHDVYCDHCLKGDMPSTRIVCIECSKGEYSQTLDLCSDCLDKDVHRTSDNKDHKSFHPSIQLRRSPLSIEINPIMEHAASFLLGASSETTKDCLWCKKGLVEKPYWQCTECEDATFICTACNNLKNKEKPWLLQRRLGVEGTHDWAHTLVLHPQDMRVVTSEPQLTTDERLTKMEARLQAMENSVSTRLQSMEGMLERVVNALSLPRAK